MHRKDTAKKKSYGMQPFETKYLNTISRETASKENIITAIKKAIKYSKRQRTSILKYLNLIMKKVDINDLDIDNFKKYLATSFNLTLATQYGAHGGGCNSATEKFLKIKLHETNDIAIVYAVMGSFIKKTPSKNSNQKKRAHEADPVRPAKKRRVASTDNDNNTPVNPSSSYYSSGIPANNGIDKNQIIIDFNNFVAQCAQTNSDFIQQLTNMVNEKYGIAYEQYADYIKNAGLKLTVTGDNTQKKVLLIDIENRTAILRFQISKSATTYNHSSHKAGWYISELDGFQQEPVHQQPEEMNNSQSIGSHENTSNNNANNSDDGMMLYGLDEYFAANSHLNSNHDIQPVAPETTQSSLLQFSTFNDPFRQQNNANQNDNITPASSANSNADDDAARWAETCFAWSPNGM